jgi:serine/threonine-protein kinase RIO1
LYEVEGIEYPDITPYNFIKVKNKIYIIDFGDAKYRDKETNWFLTEFMDGENSWNPDYK